MIKIVLILISAALISCTPSSGKISPGSSTEISDNSSIGNSIKNIQSKVSAIYKNRVLRLAVLPFVSTSKSETNDGFGKYLTENITSSLVVEKERIKLFERSRLNDILSEAALSQSGIIADKEIKKIGELAPLDYILMGTYTKLDTFIEINGRLTDVVSGEIVFSFAERVNINSEIASFFITKQDTATIIQRQIITTGNEEIDPCLEKLDEAKKIVSDISTDEKLDKCAEFAINTPFDENCGVHSYIAYYLATYKKFPSKYTEFVQENLLESQSILDGNKVENLLMYLKKDGEVSEKDWTAGLKVASKGSYMSVLNFFEQLFIIDTTTAGTLESNKKRVDQVISLLRNGKIGTPVPIEFDYLFLRFARILHFYKSKDVELSFYCYETYNKYLTVRNSRDIYKLLDKLYSSAEGDSKEDILNEIIENFNSAEASSTVLWDMYDFANDLRKQSEDEKSGISEKKLARKHLDAFKNRCKNQFYKSIPFDQYLNRTKKVFYLTEGIDAPGLPTIEKLAENLYSSEIDTQIAASALLAELGKKATPTKKRVLKVIQKQNRLKSSKSYTLIDNCMKIVLAIGEFDKETIETVLNSRFGKYSRNSDKVIAIIGEPAVPYLVNELKSKDITVQKAAIQSLAAIGKDAKKAEKELKNIQKNSNDKNVLKLIDDALDEILGIYRD